MSDYGPSTYGDRIARSYDELHRFLGDPTPCVDFLAALAGKGPALELGIGTGRVALPLAARGVDVRGVDASRRMVARMRAKRGGRKIPVTIGDMRDVPVEGRFPLVYVVFSTIFGLLTQDDQVRCFENVAKRLAPGGAFVVEAFVPDPARFDRGQRVDTHIVGTDVADLCVQRHDRAAQTAVSLTLLFRRGRLTTFPVRVRYAWPSELDLMARVAGLRLRERWANWQRAPYDAASAQHVSVYERPA